MKHTLKFVGSIALILWAIPARAQLTGLNKPYAYSGYSELIFPTTFFEPEPESHYLFGGSSINVTFDDELSAGGSINYIIAGYPHLNALVLGYEVVIRDDLHAFSLDYMKMFVESPTMTGPFASAGFGASRYINGGRLTPEVRLNFGYAIPLSRDWVVAGSLGHRIGIRNTRVENRVLLGLSIGYKFAETFVLD